MSFIYLASPYTVQNPELSKKEQCFLMNKRFEQTMELLSVILKSGTAAFSPIVHGHEMAFTHDMPKDFEFWMHIDFAMIASSYAVYVHTLQGWATSRGVTAERNFAKTIGIPVYPVYLVDGKASVGTRLD